jgi:hypothetical protein
MSPFYNTPPRVCLSGRSRLAVKVPELATPPQVGSG